MSTEDAAPKEEATFDRFAQDYESLHAKSISASGEAPEYFAHYKLQCLLRASVPTDQPILDYGCGTGNLTAQLAGHFDEIHGYDPSEDSLSIARTRAPVAHFHQIATELPDRHFGTAVLSGVLHHVPVAERGDVLQVVRSKLREGGRIYVFEHNPLNPLTRRAVAACEFDEDAELLWPWEVKRLLGEAGFENVQLDYIVFFPRRLSFLRRLERKLGWLALGAQTLSVGAKERAR